MRNPQPEPALRGEPRARRRGESPIPTRVFWRTLFPSPEPRGVAADSPASASLTCSVILKRSSPKRRMPQAQAGSARRLASQLLSDFPAQLRADAGTPAAVGGVRRRGVAELRAHRNSLRDRGAAKERKRDKEIPVLDIGAPGAPA